MNKKDKYGNNYYSQGIKTIKGLDTSYSENIFTISNVEELIMRKEYPCVFVSYTHQLKENKTVVIKSI